MVMPASNPFPHEFGQLLFVDFRQPRNEKVNISAPAFAKRVTYFSG
jgi:hypothetical protein